MYRSGFEKTLALQMSRDRISFLYEPHKLNYTTKHTYNPDFLLPNGIYVEAKGYLRVEDAAKMKAVKAQHPDKEFRMVFMDANNKIGKSTYGQWADRHGFVWADGEVPLSWLGHTS